MVITIRRLRVSKFRPRNATGEIVDSALSGGALERGSVTIQGRTLVRDRRKTAD